MRAAPGDASSAGTTNIPRAVSAYTMRRQLPDGLVRRTARFEATHHRIVPPSAGLWHVRSYAARQCLSIELGQSDTGDRQVCFARERDAGLVGGIEGRTGSR